MNIKNHRLMSDNEDHFVVHDGEAEFKVAKYMIDPATRKKIESMERHENFNCGGMVKGYAQGGAVAKPLMEQLGSGIRSAVMEDVVKPFEQYKKEIGAVSSWAGEGAKKYGGQFAKGIFGGDSSGDGASGGESSGGVASSGASSATEPSQSQVGGSPQSAGTESVSTPMASVDTSSVSAPVAQSAAPATQGPPSPTEEQKLSASNAETMGAADAYAKSLESTAKQIAGVRFKAAQDLQMRQKQFQMDVDNINQENQDLHNEILHGKINPNQLWENASAPNKILASLGIILGGIGGGMQGTGKNMALEQINRTIDADIDAQKANLNNKQNLLAKNLDKYRNMFLAEEATRNMMMTPVLAQISGIEASNIGPKAQLEAKMLKSQLMSAQNQKAHEIAKNQADLRLQMGMGTAADVALVGPEGQKSAVPLPGDRFGKAYQPEEAKELREKEASTKSAFKIADRIEELGPALYGAKKELGKQLASDMKIALMQAKGLNPKMVESSMKMLDDAIENPTEWKNILFDSGKTKSLKKTLQDALESERSSKVMNYKSAEPKKAK